MTGPAPAAIPVARHAPPGMKGAAPAAIPVAPAQKGPPVAKPAPAGAKGPVAPQAVEPTHHEDVVKHFAGHVDRANLSSAKKAAHKQTAAQVLRQMTPRALRRIVRHSQGGIHYHNDLASLRDGLAAYLEKGGQAEYAAPLRSGKTRPGGAFTWLRGKGALHLDGGYSAEQIAAGRVGSRYGRAASARDIHAHELSHAIDGQLGSKTALSQSQEWKDAYHAEIVPSLPDGTAPLSEYARKKHGDKYLYNEGFAEMGRLLYSGTVSHEEVQANFPKAYAFWVKQGLVAPLAKLLATDDKPRRTMLHEIFDTSITTGPIHIDAISGDKDER